MREDILRRTIIAKRDRIWEIKKTLMYDMSINDKTVMSLNMEAMKLSYQVNNLESELNDRIGILH